MSYKVISSDYTGFTAADATAITEYDLGYMFCLDEEDWALRIGNTGTEKSNYHLSVSGVNTTVMSGLTFSTNKVTYDYHAWLYDVPAGGVSDTVWVNYTAGDDVYMTSGTCIIKVSEY